MMQRTEVFYLMAHLIITVCIIALYGTTVLMDRPDTTLQNLLLIAGGYWFGVAGGPKIKEMMAKDKTPVTTSVTTSVTEVNKTETGGK